MKSYRIANTSTAYVFDEIGKYLTNVFVLEKEKRVYIIDTFCGPDSMAPIISGINEHCSNKEIIIINTHFHWDHIWGNCSFKGSRIISHRLCREFMDKFWDEQTNKNYSYISGRVEKCLPNITFDKKLVMHEDGLELFYSPGHTKDSISVFDHKEKVLYTGDNLEKPIVYVEDYDIQTYIDTLENYLKYYAEIIVSGHTLYLQNEDILKTIKYLKGLKEGRTFEFQTEYEREIHMENLQTIIK